MVRPRLFHFTSTTAAAAIDADGGILRPADHLLARHWQHPSSQGGRYVWLTEEDAVLGSDQVAVRFQVLDAPAAVPWTQVRRQHSPEWVDLIEWHATPETWWVSTEPVRAVRA